MVSNSIAVEQKLILEQYGNRVRVRVCGICIFEERILLVNHNHLTATNIFWAPPGGGVEVGESCTDALKREFKEETNIAVEVGQLLLTTEYIAQPLHAIEMFFEVHLPQSYVLKKGADPEITLNQQIITEVAWLSFEDINRCQPYEVHGLFGHCKSLTDICHLQRYIKL